MMRNRVHSAIVAICMILSLFNSVYAAEEIEYDYFYEAEKAKYCNWASTGGAQIQKNSKYSGGKYLNLFIPSQSGKEWRADYDVTVDAEGMYELNLASTPSGGWSSVINLVINDETEVELRSTKIKTIDGSVDWYASNVIGLREGINKLSFIIRNPRSDGNACCFFDCFTLKRTQYEPYVISSEAPFQTFQEDEELKFTFEGVGNAPTDMKVLYEVIDFEGKMIEADSFYLKAGNSKVDFKLKPQKMGPYQIIATCNGKSIVQQFLIVPSMDKRKEIDESPFAIDALPYGMCMDINGTLIEDYSELIKLTGVTWIRDRLYFDPYVKKTENGYDFTMPFTAKTGKLFNDKNIKVLMTMDMYPSVMRTDTYGVSWCTDLFEVYKFWKSLAEKYDGQVNCWEILNESDLGGGGNNKDGVDVYSSMFKAAALGIIDSNTKNEVMVSPQGAAAPPGYSTQFAEYLYKNEIYDYTDIVNYHAHLTTAEPYDDYYFHERSVRVRDHKILQEKHNVTAQNWDSESGISLNVLAGTDYNSSEQMIQAKYLATSNLEEFSIGCDRRFIFDGISFQEGGKSWGMMSRSKVAPSAYAAYGSIAAQSYALGEAKFINMLTNMPEDVPGYAFADGENTVLAMYAKNKDKHDIPMNIGKSEITLIDMFGNETELFSTNGNYIISVDDKPVYIRVKGTVDTGIISNAPVASHTELSYSQKSVEDSKRVIILQQYGDKQRNGARLGGYQLTDDTNTVKVAVYNFNNHSVSGEICGSSLSGWEIYPPTQSVEIEPMSMKELEFEVIPDGFISQRDDISFVGNLDCGTTSRSVIYANSKKVVSVLPVIEDGIKQMTVTLENTTNTPKNVEKINLSINNETVESEESITIEPKSIKKVNIPFEFSDEAKIMDINAKVDFKEGYITEFTDSIYYVTAKKKIDLTQDPSFVLPADGNIVSAMYYGEDDLSAKAWIAADKENLYMTMIVKDDVQSASQTGVNIWNNDGIQFSLGQGIPSLGIPYYELGVSLSDKNKVQMYCWNDSFNSQMVGENKFCNCEIKRDEAKKETLYEIIVPWENIQPLSYEDNLVSLSIVLNDNDGMGRNGYLEWGSGIGSTKDTSLFRTVLFSR